MCLDRLHNSRRWELCEYRKSWILMALKSKKIIFPHLDSQAPLVDFQKKHSLDYFSPLFLQA